MAILGTKKENIVSLVVGICLGLLIAYFIFTPGRYDIKHASGTYKIDKWTGKTWRYYEDFDWTELTELSKEEYKAMEKEMYGK